MTGGVMPLSGRVLVVEASTAHGSVALLADGALVTEIDARMGASREDALFPAMHAAMTHGGMAGGAIDAIVCGSGPGSFTSLRIAASLAKGLAHGRGVPMFAVSSLLLAAASFGVEERAEDAIDDAEWECVVHADALRGERFARVVAVGPAAVRPLDDGARRVPFDALPALAGGRRRLAVVSSPAAALESAVVVPRASALPRIAGWRDLAAVSLTAWEPEYGRLAEAQVVWEQRHGHALPVG